jgi:cell division protein ZapA
MDESNATTVEIFGREYKIKGADDGYIRDIARYVDEKMKEVSRGTTLPSQDRLAILAAMHIADELFQYKRESSDTLTNIERKAESLISLLDEGLDPRE